jgi:hypothetical protein
VLLAVPATFLKSNTPVAELTFEADPPATSAPNIPEAADALLAIPAAASVAVIAAVVELALLAVPANVAIAVTAPEALLALLAPPARTHVVELPAGPI